MDFYKKELDTLKRAGRYREVKLYDKNLIDLASNDYLGLSQNRELFTKAYKRVLAYDNHSPKASLLVNGYHDIHKSFEEYISKVTNFEKTIVVGSGFLANISLFESLVRKDDLLLLDEEFHASGILASKLNSNTLFFKHNDEKELEKLLKQNTYNRVIVGIEGVYSMEGDILNPHIIEVCDRFNTIMIVDEAHSMGVLGEKLLGVYDHFKITPKKNHIKMATLGKAAGSYGAYISASKHIVEYLTNRAKPIIYSTAPSVFDIALAHESYLFIQKNAKDLTKKRDKLLSLVGENQKSLIYKIDIGDNKKVLEFQELAKQNGYLIGAIRQPTVKSAILRIILRLNIDKNLISNLINLITTPLS